MQIRVNGTAHELDVESEMPLLWALRDELGLTGTKKACDRGECGACTVHVRGRRILSCMTLAVMQDGQRITTIEGISRDGDLHPVQTAFIEHDGFQCWRDRRYVIDRARRARAHLTQASACFARRRWRR